MVGPQIRPSGFMNHLLKQYIEARFRLFRGNAGLETARNQQPLDPFDLGWVVMQPVPAWLHQRLHHHR